MGRGVSGSKEQLNAPAPSSEEEIGRGVSLGKQSTTKRPSSEDELRGRDGARRLARKAKHN
jgi:hypothetical protein